jgi:hypothetical protein
MCYFHRVVKRIASILLLGILLFNWGGYRLFTGYLENRADSRLEASLDANRYNESELISIKVAANLPYIANSQNYDRVDGEIIIKGIQYKYVKRRLYNDSVELLCIPNLAKTGVRNARDDFFRLANDLATNNSSKKSTDHSHTSKFSVQDFTDDHAFVWQYKAGALFNAWYNRTAAELKSEYLSRLDKPPQA